MPENNSLQRLQELLRDLFQYDYADLDFGIYRLLRLKRGEVEAFLTEQLPRRVDEVFKGAAGNVHAQMERELAGLAERVRQEIDAEALAPTGEIKPEYREQRAKAARELIAAYEAKRQQVREIQVSEEQKAEVFNHLWAFFSRYYEAGDFIPKRRYGARETYAVPYNGEEVFFHWANRDQHYVKTAEALRDYAFTVDMLGKPCRVRFTLTEASLPPGNTKSDTRYFFPLPKEAAWDKDTRTFTLPFHYRLPTEAEIEKHGKNSKLQEAVLQAALPKIIEAVPDVGLKARLAETVEIKNPDDKKNQEEISLLLKRLRHFCQKNTSDFFIHKNLDGFLRRELEFYLKDQVLHLADIEGDLPAKQRTLRVVRQLAEELIQFLAQIENVQKRLFEKRKFVLKTDYLVPIQNVPRELWKEVAGNTHQLTAWQELFAVEPKKVNEKLLAEHPTLVVNTAHFDAAFKTRLLAGFEDLDEATDGLLIHAENYQALRFLERRYANAVDCIHIDPPYNTNSSGFLYKNCYQHSTWLAMMRERIDVATALLRNPGTIACHIDEYEVERLSILFEEMALANAGTLIWDKGMPVSGAKGLATQHEYVLVNMKGDADIRVRKKNIPAIQSKVKQVMAAHGGPTKEAITEYRDWLKEQRSFSKGERTYDLFDATGRAFRSDNMSATDRRTNPKFYVPLKHSVTKRDCPVPEYGWRYTPDTMRDLLAQDAILFGEDHTSMPRKKTYLEDTADSQMPTMYFSGSRGKTDLDDLGLEFPFAHPVEFYSYLVDAATGERATILDFFAGTGTTGHAVIDLNREDGWRRKFVLVEMAGYFDAALHRRIQKVIFTPEWKDGKPVRMATEEEAKRTPRLVKVLRLEGYEDALHNLVSDETTELEAPRAKAIKGKVGGDAYRLTYMARLPLEASASMLNLAKLEHPFAYTIEVLGEDGPRTETVDLVETFNFLYGLHVQRVEAWRDDDGKRDYRAVKAKKADGRRVLVLWRDMDKLDPAGERKFLEARLKQDGPFDEAWINGDCAVPGVQSLDGLLKRLLEEEER